MARHTNTSAARATNTPRSTAPIAVATVVVPTPPATPATDNLARRAVRPWGSFAVVVTVHLRSIGRKPRCGALLVGGQRVAGEG